MMELFFKKSTFKVLRIIGFLFLIGYFLYYKDFRFSAVGVLGYLLLVMSVVTIIVVFFKIHERFPALNDYYFFNTKSDKPLTENQWNSQKLSYLNSLFKDNQIIFTFFEDALICVPILLLGLNLVTALIGGLLFGFLHLAKFNYYECIGKAIYYTLAIYFILPLGLLTIMFGHFMSDLIILILLKLSKRYLENDS